MLMSMALLTSAHHHLCPIPEDNAHSTAATATVGHPSADVDGDVDVLQDMVACGCERNVITYSSLISACEKAGRWELALELFNEMHREGCKPNVVTYNSLIAACAQGEPPAPIPAPICQVAVHPEL